MVPQLSISWPLFEFLQGSSRSWERSAMEFIHSSTPLILLLKYNNGHLFSLYFIFLRRKYACRLKYAKKHAELK